MSKREEKKEMARVAMQMVCQSLNAQDTDFVADLMADWHPAVLAEILTATQKAYERRCNSPHPNYQSACLKLKA